MGTTDISILAIESSCDETSASIIVNGKVLNNIVATQSVHEKYGGVVPELASRAHQENLIPVVHEALSGAGIFFAPPKPIVVIITDVIITKKMICGYASVYFLLTVILPSLISKASSSAL